MHSTYLAARNGQACHSSLWFANNYSITWPWLPLGFKGFQSLLLSNAYGELLKLVDVPTQPDVLNPIKPVLQSHQMHLLEDCLLRGTKFQTWNWEMYREQFSRSSLVYYKKGLLPGSYFSGR